VRLRPFVVSGAALLGACAAVWVYAAWRACNQPDSTERPFRSRAQGPPPTHSEDRLFALLEQDGWPIDDSTQFTTVDCHPFVRVCTALGIAELRLRTGEGGYTYHVTGYGTSFDGEFRTDVLPGAMLGARISYVDFRGLEALHRPDEAFED